MLKRTSTWIVIVLLGVLLIAGAAYFRSVRPSGSASTTTSKSALYNGPIGPYAQLIKSNPDYAQGISLYAQHDYSGAIAAYQKALTKTSDFAEQQQIIFDLATATNAIGDHASAIASYTQIAENTQNIPILRAYAIEYIGRAYYAVSDPVLTGEIFNDSVYKQFLVPGDDSASYRNLFEYGATFYPLALLKLYAASWYATDLASAGSSNKDASAHDLAVIHDALSNADREVARMSVSTSNEILLIPEVLFQKARLLNQIVGIDSSISTTTVQNAYVQTLNSYNTMSSGSSNDFYTRLFYAAFLAKNSAASADVAIVLNPVDAEVGSASSAHAQYLKNAASPSSRMHAPLVLLSSIDAHFKQLLLSLGWHEEDFASSST